VKARVGDWFTFRVADGRLAAARIGAVARRGHSYTGWFFGPFDAPPTAPQLLALTREDAVWPAHFYDLEGGGGTWERVVEAGPDAEVWGVAHWSFGSENGPWLRESYDPENPSKLIGREHVDFATYDALPTRGGVTSGAWLERKLPYAFDDPVRYRRMTLAMEAVRERLRRRRPSAEPSPSGPAHTRFFLYFEDEVVAQDAGRRARELGLDADVRPSATEGLTLVLAEGRLDTEFEAMVERLEALAEQLGGEYDGHERAV
jgi:hypothetical protein